MYFKICKRYTHNNILQKVKVNDQKITSVMNCLKISITIEYKEYTQIV